MNAKRIELAHRVSTNLVMLFLGCIIAYLLCWLFESGEDGHTVSRWSQSRFGFAVFTTLIATVFARHASGQRP